MGLVLMLGFGAGAGAGLDHIAIGMAEPSVEHGWVADSLLDGSE
jgi:hypothetical protein